MTINVLLLLCLEHPILRNGLFNCKQEESESEMH